MRIETAPTRLETPGKDNDMSKIGSFKKVSGDYRGEITTLSIDRNDVRIVPTDTSNENAPSHHVVIGDAEVGAAWSKRSSDDRSYLSVKLDDPSFVAPIYAQLFENADGGYDLIWSRPSKKPRD